MFDWHRQREGAMSEDEELEKRVERLERRVSRIQAAVEWLKRKVKQLLEWWQNSGGKNDN